MNNIEGAKCDTGKLKYSRVPTVARCDKCSVSVCLDGEFHEAE